MDPGPVEVREARRRVERERAVERGERRPGVAAPLRDGGDPDLRLGALRFEREHPPVPGLGLVEPPLVEQHRREAVFDRGVVRVLGEVAAVAEDGVVDPAEAGEAVGEAEDRPVVGRLQLEDAPVEARRAVEVARLEAEVAAQVPGLDHARILGGDRLELARGRRRVGAERERVGAQQPRVDPGAVLRVGQLAEALGGVDRGAAADVAERGELAGRLGILVDPRRAACERPGRGVDAGQVGAQLGDGRRLARGDVLGLARVAFEVVELGARRLDEVPARRAHRAQLGPAEAQPRVEGLAVAGWRRAPGAGARGEQRPEAQPRPRLEPPGGAQQVGERRREIDLADDRVDPPAGGQHPRRAGDQERDVGHLLVEEEAVAALAVLAQALAMVADHDDQRPAGEPEPVETVDEPADERVGPGDLAVVGAGGVLRAVRLRRRVGGVRVEEVHPGEEALRADAPEPVERGAHGLRRRAARSRGSRRRSWSRRSRRSSARSPARSPSAGRARRS